MKEFTYSEARQRLAALLEQATRDGAVRIRRRDGHVFVLRPEARTGSPLDIRGIDLGLSKQDIVALVSRGAPARLTSSHLPPADRAGLLQASDPSSADLRAAGSVRGRLMTCPRFR